MVCRDLVARYLLRRLFLRVGRKRVAAVVVLSDDDLLRVVVDGHWHYLAQVNFRGMVLKLKLVELSLSLLSLSREAWQVAILCVNNRLLQPMCRN
jgi:hypothetical protein